MTERNSFYRKIAYLIMIAVLLFPISQLGAPSTLEDKGGTLSQLREEYDLGQADLGEIDPASEVIRFATLGMRGIAVSLLWKKANQYKMTEDWTNFRATLRQLAKLQPYFISFWRYQAWNLTYNISVELDDVKDRYHYVIRGIEFLKEGNKYNRDNAYLLAELGWFTGNKIGRADEHVQYRRLFKSDPDFHPADRPPEQRDNWLVSKKWYNDAVAAVDDKKRSLGNKNPTTFYAAAPMAQINYSEAIQSEGTFGEKARAAWKKAMQLWNAYGDRNLRSSRGFDIRMADLEKMVSEKAELERRLTALGPEIREELIAERRAALSPEQMVALEKMPQDRTDEEHEQASDAEMSLHISMEDIANRVAVKTPEQSAAARKLANQIAVNSSRLAMIQNNRQVVNYEYWKTRCELEQESSALKAHELAFAADQAFREDANLVEAKNLYEECFALWAEVLAKYPQLPDDSATGSTLMEIVDKYSLVLEQLDLSLTDEEVAEKFQLWNIIEVNDIERKYVEALEARNSRGNPPLQEDANPLLREDDESDANKSENP